MTRSPKGGIRPAFRRKLDRAKSLMAACDAVEEGELKEARDRYKAMVGEIAHVTVSAGTNLHGAPITLSTQHGTEVAIALSAVKRPFGGKEYMQACRTIAAAHRQRQAEEREAARAVGLSTLNAKSNRLLCQAADAEWRFAQTPVVSVAELELKIAFCLERQMFADDCMGEYLLADVRALLERGA